MPIDESVLGRWFEAPPYAVSAEAIRAYADATNDDNPAYRGAEAVAPPLFGIVSGWRAVELCAAGALSHDLLSKVVHQMQDMRMSHPVRAGQTVQSRGRLAGVVGGPRATSVVAHVDQPGIGEFYATIYIRQGGETTSGESPPATGAGREGEPVAVVGYDIDEDQAARYADASGDRNPIHLDDEAARAIGLDGVILHGMCTLALACRAAVDELCARDPARVRRFAARLSRPVKPGQELTTTFWRSPDDGVYAFECTTPSGVVVRDGAVEIS